MKKLWWEAVWFLKQKVTLQNQPVMWTLQKHPLTVDVIPSHISMVLVKNWYFKNLKGGHVLPYTTGSTFPAKNPTDIVRQQNKYFGSLALPDTYKENHHSQIIYSSRTSSSNWVFHKIPLSKSILSDHDMDEYG